MKVAGVHIERYRGIADLRLPLRAATALIGANGAGKSSILEAMGYDPTEEGAAERDGDEPAVVWWYYSLPKVRPLAMALRSVTANADELQREINSIAWALRAKAGPNGPELALDLFALLEGEVPGGYDAPDRRLSAHRVRTVVEPLAASHPWAAIVLAALPASGSAPYLLDLGVPCDVALPDRPVVVSMVVDADDISALLYRHLERVLAAWCKPLLEQRPDIELALERLALGFLQPAVELGLVMPALDAMANLASQLLPAFVAGHGALRFELRKGPDSMVGVVERLLIDVDAAIGAEHQASSPLTTARRELRKLNDTLDQHIEAVLRRGVPGADYDYSRLGTGVRRWVSGAVDEAGRRLASQLRSDGISVAERLAAIEAGVLPPPVANAAPGSPAPPTLRLIDEPVACLEPRVHGQVVRWLHDRLADNETLVLATHQAAVLQAVRLPDRDEMVAGVWREGELVNAAPIGVRLLEQLDLHRDRLGVTSPELLFSARAVLAVEGQHDVRLLRAMYGDQLAEHGVVFVIIGSSNATALVGALVETVHRRLRLPVWVMLDASSPGKTTGKPARRSVAPAVEVVDEARPKVSKWLQNELRPLPFGRIDILAGLSVEHLAKAFPGGAFPAAPGAERVLRDCENSDGVKAALVRWAYPGERDRKIGDVVDGYILYLEQTGVGSKGADKVLRATMRSFFEELDEWTSSSDTVRDRTI